MRSPIAPLVNHFMAFAPLDVWARLLADARWRVTPRYWARLAWALTGSAFGTLLTLPERVALAPVLRARAAHFDHAPGVVIVVGYYRSGTTHLHNLLSCDPRFTTPRWNQALAPHGWWLSWALLRAALIPFLPNKRPQDDVPFGPDWPAEDDFAACNLALASSLPGRLVFPSRAEHWGRFHDLRALTDREMSRWRHATRVFLWKITRTPFGRTDKAILLKTPSHTARLAELTDLLGADRVRCIHVSREPEPVMRSNLSLHRRLAGFLLEDAPDEQELRERLIDEYARTEAKFLRDADSCGARVARARYQDLVADPLAELERAYADLGLEWTDDFRARAARYLRMVGEYRSAHGGDGRANAAPAGAVPSDPRLAELRARFGHDTPARPTAPLPDAAHPPERTILGWLALAPVCLVIASAWLALAWMTHDRFDILAWPAGLALGLTAARAAGRGSTALGIAAGALTLALYAGVVWPATYLAYSHAWLTPAKDTWIAVRDLSTKFGNHALFLALGVLTAYRAASRKHLRPPGL